MTHGRWLTSRDDLLVFRITFFCPIKHSVPHCTVKGNMSQLILSSISRSYTERLNISGDGVAPYIINVQHQEAV